MCMDAKTVLLKNVEALASEIHLPGRLPSVAAVREVMRLVKALLFPDFFDETVSCQAMRRYAVGVNMSRLYDLLSAQIGAVSDADARETTLKFIDSLPEMRSVLLTDVDAIYANDPAVNNRAEVVFCYPSVHALIHYRAAHALLLLDIPIIPRMITELAHSATGIDIHPGASIGGYFAIDHGTGVVIGQTCIIGEHVTIYQGVTLGSKNFTLNADGHPENLPRHPIIEDDVTIYSNASVLGRVTIGRGAVIGGNVWVTSDVPPGGRVTQ